MPVMGAFETARFQGGRSRQAPLVGGITFSFASEFFPPRRVPVAVLRYSFSCPATCPSSVFKVLKETLRSGIL